MPSPYELKFRWLEWHEGLLDIESLKRQIATIKREIEGRQRVRAYIEKVCPEDQQARLIEMLDSHGSSIAELDEVLATLERMLPPF